MTILDSIAGALTGNGSPRPQGSPRTRQTSSELSQALQNAEATVATLRARYSPLAYRAATDPQAEADFDALDTELASAERAVRRLNAVLSETKKAERIAEAILAENTFETQKAAVEAHLGTMRRAAVDFSEIAGKLSKAWKKLLDAKHKAEKAAPVGFSWPSTQWLTDATLVDAARADLYRVSGVVNDLNIPTEASLPGSQPPFQMAGAPDKIESLVDAIAGRAENITSAMKAHSRALKAMSP
jgi:hypothetical protein